MLALTHCQTLATLVKQDLPVFPPLAIFSLFLLGLFLKMILPSVKVLPKRLDTASFRGSAFVVGLGITISCVKLTEDAFKAHSTAVNFEPVPKLCTNSILGIVRNPIYSAAMFALAPGLIMMSNTLYMVFTQVRLCGNWTRKSLS